MPKRLWRQAAAGDHRGGKFPHKDTQPLRSPSHRPGLGIRPSGSVRPRSVARASPVVRISPDLSYRPVASPTRRVSWGHTPGRLLGGRGTSPLWDAASTPRRGTPSYGRHPYAGRTSTHILPGQRAHPPGKPGRPPPAHCGTSKSRPASESTLQGCPPGHREDSRPPHPPTGIRKTPSQDARPEKDVIPRLKAPFTPSPLAAYAATPQMGAPTEPRDGRPRRKQRDRP